MMDDQSEEVSDAPWRTVKIENFTSAKINHDILRKLKENDPSLQYIEASDPYFSRNENQYYLGSPLEVRALAVALGTNRSLKRLDICNHKIGNAGAYAFAEALCMNCTLEELNLNSNNIGNKGACALASALVNNSNLKDLGLRNQQCENDDINYETWTKFSELLCNVSSINATYCSNHTLKAVHHPVIWNHSLDELNSHLLLNHVKSNVTLVRMEKILKHHRYFDMRPFFEQGPEMLPYVFDWLERARSHASSDPALNYAEEGSDNTIAIEEERILNEKLNAINQFARAMPEIFDREAQIGATLKRKYNMV